jgi:hypothetical protein
MDNKLTAEIKSRAIPALYTQEKALDPMVYLEINIFGFPWRWFVSECELEPEAYDVLFFGYVCGLEKEWGYFRLSDIKETRRPVNIRYEFQPMPFSEVKKAYQL